MFFLRKARLRHCAECKFRDKYLLFCFFIFPYFFCEVEYSPCFGPSCIEGGMSYNRGDFLLSYAVIFGILQMICQGRIGNPLRHECNNGYNASGFYINIGNVPVFAEKNIIIKMRKFGRKFSESFFSGILCNFFHNSRLLSD